VTVVVGVDGGGTRTRAVVLDVLGEEIGRAEGPGGVVTLDAPEVAVRAVTAAVEAAVRQTGRQLPVAVLWAGLAGAGGEACRRRVTTELHRAGLAARVVVGTDADAAFAAAFEEGPGILLIAGTGSIAVGRLEDGTGVRVGGWGRTIGDEGSGYAIGVAALQAVMRAQDGRAPPTALTEPILAWCDVADPFGLVHWIDRASKAEVAALVPIVARAADEGDESATEVLAEAVVALEKHVAAMLGREGWPARVPLVLWGGLVAEGGPLRDAMVNAMAAYPVKLSGDPIDPPAGAATMALRLL